MTLDKKYLIIMNRPCAGLFSSFIQVLGELHYCKTNNMIPVVFFGSNWVYWSPGGYNGSINGWEYFFSAVSEYSIADIVGKEEDYLEKCNIFDFDNEHIIPNKNPNHVYDLSRKGHIKLSPNITVVNKWPDFHLGIKIFLESRRLTAFELISEYIVVHSNIIEKIDDYYYRYMDGNKVIGVHMRGGEREIEMEERYGLSVASESIYMEEIDSCIEKNPEALLFVATDTECGLEQFKKRYGQRCLYYNSKRSSEGASPHMEYGGAKVGEEMLIEALLLSKTDYFVHGISNVAFGILCFNPGLRHIDVYEKYNNNIN